MQAAEPIHNSRICTVSVQLDLIPVSFSKSYPAYDALPSRGLPTNIH